MYVMKWHSLLVEWRRDERKGLERSGEEKRGVERRRDGSKREILGGERCSVTSLVSQISPRAAPQAFPGVAFQGMIP